MTKQKYFNENDHKSVKDTILYHTDIHAYLLKEQEDMKKWFIWIENKFKNC
jgi:hypothetical protein